MSEELRPIRYKNHRLMNRQEVGGLELLYLEAEVCCMRIHITPEEFALPQDLPRHLQACQIRKFYFLANFGVLFGFLIEDSLDLDRMG